MIYNIMENIMIYYDMSWYIMMMTIHQLGLIQLLTVA